MAQYSSTANSLHMSYINLNIQKLYYGVFLLLDIFVNILKYTENEGVCIS